MSIIRNLVNRSLRQRIFSARESFRRKRRYSEEIKTYKQLCGKAELIIQQPCLGDWTAETQVEPTYYYQDSWAFERIWKNRPGKHFDIGSHHKFVALLSKVVDTTMIDIRPLPVVLDSLAFIPGSILQLPFSSDSVESISSICVVEHIGLGRYGDPLDPDGTKKAVAELKRVLAPGGHLYLSVPIDDVDRTYFNAHRAFTENTFLQMMAPLDVVDKAYIYGFEFVRTARCGFGTLCVELRKPLA